MTTLILIIQVILEVLIIALIYTGMAFMGFFISEKLQGYYYKWKKKRRLRQWEKDYELILQERRRIELRRKEKERYPLFYLKEGIV